MTEAADQRSADNPTLLPTPRGGARTWYEVLDIREDANEAEILKAYERALAIVEGRSIGGYLMLDPSAAESARADVEAAFAILGDGARRGHYDRVRNGEPDPSAEAAPSASQPPVRFLNPVVETAETPPAKPAPATKRAIRFEAPAVADDEEFTVPPRSDNSVPPQAAMPPPLLVSPAFGSRAPSSHTPAAGSHPPMTSPMLSPVTGSHTVVAGAPTTPPTAAGPALAVALPDGPIAGAFIKDLRIARGLSVLQLADATKIRREYLTAIEDEDIPSLPARVYLRGFLTQIARVLKVDRQRLAEGYLQFAESKGRSEPK